MQNQAIVVHAKKDCIDKKGNKRIAGEKWLVKETGNYLVGVDEEIEKTLNAQILTDKDALHLKALKTFEDVYNKKRKAGSEWLVTLHDSEAHIVDVHEEVVDKLKKTTLNKKQQCVLCDPWNDSNNSNDLGKKTIKVGEDAFFLKPGEYLEEGIQDVMVLSEEDSLLIKATQHYTDKNDIRYKPGEKWLVTGPCDFIKPIEVEIVESLKAIPLDENEGV